MELTSLLVIAIVIIYLSKNEKGKAVVNHFGNTAVHLAASADKASAALERQCDELLMSDEEAAEAKIRAKAKIAKAKAKKDLEDLEDAL